MLTRPVAIVYFAVVAVVFALTRVPRRTIALFTAAALVLPLAWAVRNKIEGGDFTVSVIGANNLLMYRAAGVMAILDEGDFERDLATEQRDLLEETHDVIQQKEHVAAAEDLPEGVRAPYYSAAARGFRNYWYPVMLSRQLGKQPTGIMLCGEKIVLARHAGKAYALHNRCPHRGVPLSEGRQEFPGLLTCAYHGGKFDIRDGRCLKHPYETHPCRGFEVNIGNDGTIECK